MKERKMEAAVLGALNIDITGTANVPFSSASSLPGEVRTSLGGTGWNAARACALLGMETSFFSVLASDSHESAIRAEAQALGIDLSPCRWDEGENNVFLSLRDSDERLLASVNDMTFSRRMDSFFCGAAARSMADCKAAAADCDLQADALAKLCEKLPEDVPLIVSAVSASKCARVRPVLARVHSLLLGETEAEKLTGYAGAERGAAALLKQGVFRVCVTLGAEGFLWADREDMRRVTDCSCAGAGADAALTAVLTLSAARALDADRTVRLLTAAAAIAARSPSPVSPDLYRLKPYL